MINTQRMWCSNQAMILSQLAFFEDEPPVIVDWAPWHHTAGGNHNFGFVLYNGGTLYIDEGKPAPGAIETTVRNLREVATNWYFTVPKGYEALLPYFRADAQLRQTFFSRLKVLWFAGAALSQPVFDEMQELAIDDLRRAHPVPDRARLDRDRADGARAHVAEQGLDQYGRAGAGRGAQARADAKASSRPACAGPTSRRAIGASPSSPRRPSTRRASTGSATRSSSQDPADPREGLLFDGRIAEDFKLATGTWVNVGPLRARLLEQLAPYARDVVIAGADRDEIGVLIFPNLDACRALAADARRHRPAMQARARRVSRPADAFAKTSTGSSNRVCRAILLAEPPSLDAGEMTDKGSINQRAVLRSPRRPGGRALRGRAVAARAS